MGRTAWTLGLALALGCFPGASAIPAQQRVDVEGVVVSSDTGRGIADVILRVEGTDVSAASDEQGRFVLRGLVPGNVTLRLDHVAYGSRSHPLAVPEEGPLQIRIELTPQAVRLEPLVVEAMTSEQMAARAKGASRNVVEREQLQRAIGTSKHLGDVIRQTIPGIRLRQSNNLAGTNVCIEFRGAASISLLERRACNSPLVFVDGVPVSDPNFLYGSMPLSTLERIQVIPPGDAGARYGTGSLYGVILIETARPGLPRDASSTAYVPDRRSTFDWSEDPAGHPFWKAALGAFVGNAVGLAAGVAAGRRCFDVGTNAQIDARCSGPVTVGAGAAALSLPAAGSALGVRWGGATDRSVGRLLPALVGAGMMIFPGYAFSMSTVGGGSHAANVVGAVFLVVGTPLVTTLADRMFRELR